MKYHLFAYKFHSQGGMEDYVGVFHTLEEAFDHVHPNNHAHLAVMVNGKLMLAGKLIANFDYHPVGTLGWMIGDQFYPMETE